MILAWGPDRLGQQQLAWPLPVTCRKEDCGSWIMRTLNPKNFVFFISDLTRYAEELPDVAALQADAAEAWLKWLSDIRDACDRYNMVASRVSVNNLIATFSAPEFSAPACRQLAAELRGRLLDEMGARLFLSLTPTQTAFFSDAQPFGANVAAAFPSAAYDIEEATKCIALERSTASVFHLARVMEFAIRLVAKELKFPVQTNPNWEHIIRPLRDALNKPPKDRAAEWDAAPTFFASVTERVMAVRDAWRNAAMHVEGKYTEEEAIDIWNAVRGFMRQLATRLKE